MLLDMKKRTSRAYVVQLSEAVGICFASRAFLCGNINHWYFLGILKAIAYGGRFPGGRFAVSEAMP
jgi:hypothetical protein